MSAKCGHHYVRIYTQSCPDSVLKSEKVKKKFSMATKKIIVKMVLV